MANTYTYSGYYDITFDGLTGAYSINGAYISDPFIFGDENDGDLSDGTTGDGLKDAGQTMYYAYVPSPTTILPEIYEGWMVGVDGIITSNGFGTYSLSTSDAGLSGSGTAISVPVLDINALCFLSGTRIATPNGERTIESLTIGDLVTTASGARKAVKWIGRMSIPPSRFSREAAAPVRISSGALGHDLPRRDLYVSADHAIFLDGVLVNAGVLVNGTTIVRCIDRPGEVIEYFHVMLEGHELILAEGVATESLVLDDDSLRKFDNADAYRALYPNAVPGLPMPYGRIASVRQLPRTLRARLEKLFAA